MPGYLAKYQTAEEAIDRLKELRHDFQELPEFEQRSDDDASRVDRMIREVNELDNLVSTFSAEQLRTATLKSIDGLASTRQVGTTDTRSLGQMVVENAEIADYIAKGCPLGVRAGVDLQGSMRELLEIRALGEGASGTGLGTGGYQNFDSSGAGYLLPMGQPIAPIARQAKLYLRDLIPVMTTTLASIPYVQELSPTANESATAIAENAFKNETTLSFTGAKADPTTIVTTIRLSKQLFEDAPLVVQYINQRLPYQVHFKEDAEILNGSGTWPDMQGILGTTGVQTQAFTNSDIAQALGMAFADIENVDLSPSAVVMNPTDAWTMFTKRAASGSGTFDAGTPFNNIAMTVWGEPVYRTRAKAAGTALAADFARGAILLDRQSLNVQLYQERYAELNQVLVIAEQRVGLAVVRPDAFVNVTV